MTAWWLPAAAVASLVGSMVVPFSPLAHGAFALVGAVPAVVVGLRLIARHRAETAAAA